MAFETIQGIGFDFADNGHAKAIFDGAFPRLADEIESILGEFKIRTSELVAGGGGEAPMTQRLRRAFTEKEWVKHEFIVEKIIDGQSAISQSHEVDHIRRYNGSIIGLEIEWNNKDPFYDRDLDNFNRLHSDSVIAVGVIVTRGRSLHAALERLVKDYALRHGLTDFSKLQEHDIGITDRQAKNVRTAMSSPHTDFAAEWSKVFVRDKFGSATTHWSKLQDRADRGVGAPCPWVGIGIPLDVVVED